MATLVVALLLVIPGTGASLALYPPRRLGIPTRIASVFGLGYAVDALLATTLTSVHAMRPVVFFVGLGVLTVGFWLLALRRGSLVDHLRAMTDEARRDPWPLLLGGGIVLLVAVVDAKFSPLVNFAHPEPWRYWADAQEVARAGRVPDLSIHYGMAVPPTVSKIGLNAFSAGVIFAIGSSPLPAMGALTWLVALGTSFGLWSLGKELGFRYLAPLLVILLQPEPRWGDAKTGAIVSYHYNAIFVGRMVAICALALGVHALKGKRKAEIPIVGVVLGMGAATHLIPTAIVIALLFWYAASFALSRRRIVQPFVTVVGIAGVAGVVVLAAIVGSGGDIGFQGAAGKNRYSNFPPNFDPTLFLSKEIVDQPPILQPATRERVQHGWYILPGKVLRDYADRILPFDVSTTGAFVTAAVGLAIAVLMFLWLPARLRQLGLVAWGYAASLVVVALGFSWFYETKVPGDFGVRRLIPSVRLAPFIMGLALAEGLLWWLGRVRPRLRTGVAVAALVALTALYAPLSGPSQRSIEAGEGSVRVLNWLRDHVPREARLLSNRRTAGTYAANIGNVSVTEGMTPFLRPAMLKRVVLILLDARDFFRHPKRNQWFLSSHRVDYIVFTQRIALGKGFPIAHPGVEPRLANATFVRLVHRDPFADIYRVVSA